MEKFVQENEKLVDRILEMIPGILTWSLILSPIWLGLIYPNMIVYLLTFMAVYWFYLALKHTTGMIIGYRKYKREMSTNWLEELRKLDFNELPHKETLPASYEETKHFILVPAVRESHNVLKGCIDSIFAQTIDTKKIHLVYTIEEKWAKETTENIYKALDGREDRLGGFYLYVHPAGIPGEAIGVGSANRAWGARHAVEDLIKRGENPRNFIFSSLDSDHVLNEQYLARLEHLYLTSDKRDNKFFTTAVHSFDNNHWQVPVMMRIEANAVTLGGMSDWAVSDGKLKDTFAAYSASLQTLIDANYWDVSLPNDDTVFYWRAFFLRDGDFEGRPHYIPYSADAVEGSSYMKSHVNLYKQLLRWGWGIVAFPISLKGFIRNKKVPLDKKVLWIMRHVERSVILINIVYLITFGFAVLTAINPTVKQTNFAYSLPDLISVIMTMTLIFLLPGAIIRHKMVAKMPEHWPLWKKLLAFMEAPIVILNLLTYSFFPWVEAQTKMMLGKKAKKLYATEKVR